MWMNVSTLPASMREHVIIMKDHISVIARTDGKDKTVKKVRMQKKNKYQIYLARNFTL